MADIVALTHDRLRDVHRHRHAAGTDALERMACTGLGTPERRGLRESPARVYIPPMKANAILLTIAAGRGYSGYPPPKRRPTIPSPGSSKHTVRARCSGLRLRTPRPAPHWKSDALFSSLFAEARVIAEAKDRIPQPSVIGGRVFNFLAGRRPTSTGSGGQTSRRLSETQHRNGERPGSGRAVEIRKSQLVLEGCDLPRASGTAMHRQPIGRRRRCRDVARIRFRLGRFRRRRLLAAERKAGCGMG